MTTTLRSDKKYMKVIEENPQIWEIKSDKHLLKFWKWIQKKHLIPGDVIPKRVFKKYYRKKESESNGNKSKY